MRLVSSSPALLRMALSAWTRSSTRPSRRSSSSSVVSKATLMPSSSAIAQPSSATHSPRITSSGSSTSPAPRRRPSSSCARRPGVELVDVAVLERGPHLGQLGAEPRPEQPQVRQQLHAGDGPLVESDLLDAQLLGDLVGVPRGRARAAHIHAAQRLAEPEVGLAARAAPELNDVAHRRDLRQELFVPRALAA